jgi:branched-chain amino acid transport system substrate-binding protein
MNHKSLLTYTGITIIIASMLVFSFGCEKEEDAKEINIGAILPLSGQISVYGTKMKKGIDLAVNQWNARGGIEGKQIKILYEDDQGDPKTSVSAVQKLIKTKMISVIIGGAISATALPIVPIINQNKVVLFSPAATSPKLSGISPYFFRNWPSDTYDGSAMGQFAAKNLKLRKVSVLYVNNEWGIAITKIFCDKFNKNGGEILQKESYEQNATDFRTQLIKIKNSKSAAIFIPGYLKELINILRQKKELGVKATILSSYGFYDSKILELATDAAEGAIFTAPTFDSVNPSPVIKVYLDNYQKEYGEKPDIWSAQAYDAMNIIATSIERKKHTGNRLRDEIAKTRNYEGVSGNTSFNDTGEVLKPLKLMMVKNGKFIDFNAKEK